MAVFLWTLLLAACTYLPFERDDYKVYPTAENPTDFFGRVYAKTRTAAVRQQRAANTEEASQLVGFPVSLPTYLPQSLEPSTELIIETPHSYQVDVDLSLAQELIQSAGIPGDSLPSTPENIRVNASVGAGVIVSMGTDANFITFIQTRNPAIDLPPDGNATILEELGRLGWQYLGLSRVQAEQFSKRMNWASFLVLPPADMDSAEGIEFNGKQAVMLESSDLEIPHKALLWEDDSILYGLYSNYPGDELLKIAGSLR